MNGIYVPHGFRPPRGAASMAHERNHLVVRKTTAEGPHLPVMTRVDEADQSERGRHAEVEADALSAGAQLPAAS